MATGFFRSGENSNGNRVNHLRPVLREGEKSGRVPGGPKNWLPETDAETKCERRESRESEQMFGKMLESGADLSRAAVVWGLP